MGVPALALRISLPPATEYSYAFSATRTWNRRGVLHYSLAGADGVWSDGVFRAPTSWRSTPGFISDAYAPASGVGLTSAPT